MYSAQARAAAAAERAAGTVILAHLVSGFCGVHVGGHRNKAYDFDPPPNGGNLLGPHFWVCAA